MSNVSPWIVSSKRMEGIFRHGDVACVVECLITTEKLSGRNQQYHTEIKTLLRKHDQVLGKTPSGRLSNREFEHTIELEEGEKPVITTPYRHPNKFKDEIEKSIKALLEMGHTKPSSSPLASSLMLVKKKHGTMQMCIYYGALNKKTIKNIYPIPMIDELMDELHGEVYFLKIDLRSGYHQIKVRAQDITKTIFRCHYGH